MRMEKQCYGGNFDSWLNMSQAKMFACAEDLISVEMDSVHRREEDVGIQSIVCWYVLYIKYEFELYESVFCSL